MAVVYANEGKLDDIDFLLVQQYKVMLFKNNITPDVDTVFADLDIADFSGYGDVVITWTTPSINGDQNAEAFSQLCQFIHDGGGTGNDIYGWVMIRDFVNKIICIERYADAPRPMVGVPDEIRVTVQRTQGECV